MIASTVRAGIDSLRPRSLVVVLGIFFVAIYCQYVAKVSHSEHGNRSAFLRWRTQLKDLDDGGNVWDKYAYPNPPIMAIILKPFFQLSPLAGASLWFYAKAVMALASILIVFAMLRSGVRSQESGVRSQESGVRSQESGVRSQSLTLDSCPRHPDSFPLWGKLLAVGLSLRSIEGDLVHGNVNLFILFLIATSLFAFCRRREYLAGFLLGLAIACKLTPALFLPYFLWKRAWRTLFGAALGLSVFVVVIPSLVFGWSENWMYHRSWHRQMVAPYAAGEVTSEHKNQSLPGLLHRMLADQPSFSDYAGDRRIVLETHNLVSWQPGVVQGIVAVCLAIYLLLAAWRCRAQSSALPSLQMMAEFSVVLLGMLLFCERTWKHHCVILLIPFSTLSYALSAGVLSRGMRWYLAITLVVVAVLMLSTSSGHVDAAVEAHARLGKLAQVYGAYVWVFLLLLAGALAMCRASKPEA